MVYLEPFRGQSFWRTECRVWSAGEIYLAGDKVRGEAETTVIQRQDLRQQMALSFSFYSKVVIINNDFDQSPQVCAEAG